LAALTRGEALPPLPSSVHTEDEGEGEVGDEAPVDLSVDSSEDEEANDGVAPATAPLPLAPTAADVAVDMGARVGDRLEARDARGGWYVAKIVDARAGRSVDAGGEARAGAEVGAAPPAETQSDDEARPTARPYSELLVHFVGWKARWDEWIRMGEGRLRAIDDGRRAAEARGAVLAAAPATAPASDDEDEAGEDEDEDEDEEMVSPGRAVDAEDSEGDDDADEGADEQTGRAVGNLVWARVPGFPAWPAVIERARAKHRALKPAAASLASSANADDGPGTVAGAGRPVFVRFLGARAQETFAWAAPSSVISFGERLELCEQKLSKRSLRPRFKQAVAEAIALLGAASADS